MFLIEKTDVLKTSRKSKFLWKKIWRNALDLKSKKVQGIFGETFILALLSSTLFLLQNCASVSYNLFCSEDKRFLSEFLGKWSWFQEYNEHFPKYPGWKLKFQKTETWFCSWKSTDNNDIKIFLVLENPFTFLLVKEKICKRI